MKISSERLIAVPFIFEELGNGAVDSFKRKWKNALSFLECFDRFLTLKYESIID